MFENKQIEGFHSSFSPTMSKTKHSKTLFFLHKKILSIDDQSSEIQKPFVSISPFLLHCAQSVMEWKVRHKITSHSAQNFTFNCSICTVFSKPFTHCFDSSPQHKKIPNDFITTDVKLPWGTSVILMPLHYNTNSYVILSLIFSTDPAFTKFSVSDIFSNEKIQCLVT